MLPVSYTHLDVYKRQVDACAKNGGGTVLIPAGIWKSGKIHLKSHVHLHLETDAVISFSDSFEDYLPVVFTRWEGTECYNYSPLIYAENCEDISKMCIRDRHMEEQLAVICTDCSCSGLFYCIQLSASLWNSDRL